MRGKREPIDVAALVRDIERAEPRDPLARIAAAAATADRMREVADVLIDHFVAAARDAEVSWSQIGGALGVSKQAAQQRYVMPGLDDLSPSARQIVEVADAEAGNLGHNFIGLEHVVIALAATDSPAKTALGELGITAEALRGEVGAMIGRGPVGWTGPKPFTPRAKKVLTEIAPQEADALGDADVGPAHLLLALSAFGSNAGAEALRRVGTSPTEVRAKVVDVAGRK